MMDSNASHQSKYPEGLPAELSGTDLLMDTSDDQQPTATNITQTTNEAEHDATSDHAKFAKKSIKV